MNLFAPRWKRYAPWPVVIWCRIADHMQRYPGFCAGGYYRCARCGDALEPLNHKVGVGFDGGTT